MEFSRYFAYFCNVSVLACLGVNVLLTEGSGISFNSSQAVIQPLLRQNLTLRCSLLNVRVAQNVHSGGIVGRDVASDEHVTSIVVSLGGSDVASVALGIPVRSHGDHDTLGLVVSGDLTGDQDTLGYIELNWVAPSRKQTGNFTCDVTGTNGNGYFLLTQSLAVTYQAPTVEDIVDHLGTVEMDNLDLMAKWQAASLVGQEQALQIATLTNQSNGQTIQNNTHQLNVEMIDLHSKYNGLQDAYDQLKANNTDLGSKLQDLSSSYNILKANTTDTQTTLQGITALYDELKSNNTVLGTKLRDLTTSYGKLNSKNTDISSNVLAIYTRLDHLQSSNDQLNDNHTSLSSNFKDLEISFAILQSSYGHEIANNNVAFQHLTSSYDELKSNNTDMATTLQGLSSSLIQMKATDSGVGVKLQELTSMVDRLNTSNVGEDKEIQQLHQILNALQSNSSGQAQSIQDLNQKYSQLRTEYGQMHVLGTSQSSSIQDLVIKYDQLRNDLVQLTSNVTALANQNHQDSSTCCVTLQDDVKHLSDNYSAMKTDLTYAVADVAHLKDQTATLFYNLHHSPSTTVPPQSPAPSTDLAALQTHVAKVDAHLTLMGHDIDELFHVEHGVVDCGDSTNWFMHSDAISVYTQKTVTFSHAYLHAPVVHVSRAKLRDIETNEFFNYIILDGVTTTNFKVDCGKASFNDDVEEMTVSWTSIPARN